MRGPLLFSGLLLLCGTVLLAAPPPPKLFDADGKAVDFERRFGKRQRVLIFAGLGTPAEQAMLDLVQENIKRIRSAERSSVAVVFVAMTPRQADDYCRGREYEFPWLCDPSGSWLGPLGIDFLPTLIVQSPEGQTRYRTTALSAPLIRSVVRHPEQTPGPSR
ncbi:MAG: hypothetical protein HY303_21465 [Candidatus Wallbacteria bacterium]|nr:hypothetical protein [Candidatus Wallbacteria bacterium]